MQPFAAVLAATGPIPVHWDADRVILYQLGLGAGDAPTDPDEMAYVDESRLQVLPTFATVPAGQASSALLTLPALAHHPDQLLHVAQELVLHQPIPAAADGTATATVSSVFDRGTAAEVVLAVDLATEGQLLATVRFHLWFRGEGGFGGERPSRIGGAPPLREPDAELQVRTLPQLAAIFRLSADRHPLHIDPAFAADLGYPAPLLAGLCTWGVVGKAMMTAFAGGDPTALAAYSARFDGPVYPGETLELRCWRDDADLQVVATVAERAHAPAMTGRLTLHH